PVRNHLVDHGNPLPRTKFFIPGSLLATRIDLSSPVAQGMNEETVVFFDNSPVFNLGPEAASQGVKAIAKFDSNVPLRSGWAWGQEYLKDGVVAVEASVGQGKVFLFGPEILKRAQPHATFKFLFNSIFCSKAVAGHL